MITHVIRGRAIHGWIYCSSRALYCAVWGNQEPYISEYKYSWATLYRSHEREQPEPYTGTYTALIEETYSDVYERVDPQPYTEQYEGLHISNYSYLHPSWLCILHCKQLHSFRWRNLHQQLHSFTTTTYTRLCFSHWRAICQAAQDKLMKHTAADYQREQPHAYTSSYFRDEPDAYIKQYERIVEDTYASSMSER